MATGIAAKELLLRRNGQRHLTDEQVNEIRMSTTSAAEFARRFGVKDTTVGSCRRGETYGPLTPEQVAFRDRQEQLARENNSPYVGLSVGRIFGGRKFGDYCPLEARDAAWECEHGRLPHDRTPACGCWPQEETQTNPTPGEPHADTHQHRLARFADQAAASAATAPGSEHRGRSQLDDRGRPGHDQTVHA